MSRFEAAYAQAVAQATPRFVPYDLHGDGFNSVALYNEFADIHARLVTDGYYEQSLAHNSSPFVAHGMRQHDMVLARVFGRLTRPLCERVYDRLEAALDDGEPAILVQPRFDSIDLTSATPDIRARQFIKLRTQLKPVGAMADFASRGTNGVQELIRTPELAQKYREERVDEVLGARQIDKRLGISGYRPILVADMMRKVVEVVKGNYFEKPEDRLQLAADWIVGQTIHGHGITGREALFYAGRQSNAEIVPGAWMSLANTNIFIDRTGYYGNIAATARFVGNAMLRKAIGAAMPRSKQQQSESHGISFVEPQIEATQPLYN